MVKGDEIVVTFNEMMIGKTSGLSEVNEELNLCSGIGVVMNICQKIID